MGSALGVAGEPSGALSESRGTLVQSMGTLHHGEMMVAASRLTVGPLSSWSAFGQGSCQGRWACGEQVALFLLSGQDTAPVLD